MTFVEILSLIIVTTLAIIAIVKFAIKFDYVKWREYKDKRIKERIEELCTHTDLEPINGSVRVTSRFHKPPMSFVWVCGDCGITTSDLEYINKVSAYWGKNPDIWLKQVKKRARLVKKRRG